MDPKFPIVKSLVKEMRTSLPTNCGGAVCPRRCPSLMLRWPWPAPLPCAATALPSRSHPASQPLHTHNARLTSRRAVSKPVLVVILESFTQNGLRIMIVILIYF
ncbi:hypothetical protein BDA96_07G182100 [Sorghum bicolor]|uniref:Uncharacterized protein n=1 Tax=Sorghum bicolor TaxID=4558 RepID=A0A921QP44_SORBI|nr:hypothetical protein BDA96_07G182100 [Sorghum bicolor]